ncbi:MAG: UDP-2,4-diacetamido-2,4,6-trideoxy-beta-L-altropyranose hydrolase [Candidatus Omnitrophica bacterium]|nr:UDP-2,4-diacetamido-2,4,6-trideoxy-beta-L-altropyranose hydrolase [Candidatus Omnitrophota bacterium]
MQALFRVDAAPEIGSGHLIRCLALANILVERGLHVSFICRRLNKGFESLINKNGCDIFYIEDDSPQAIKKICTNNSGPSYLVIDNYGLNIEWEKAIRPFVDKVMVIDDMGSREHICDFLLDQNLYKGLEDHYKSLVSGNCQMLLGPRFALLRKEFAIARQKTRVRSGLIKKILIFFGGSDMKNITKNILEGVFLLKRQEIAVNLVIGVDNPNKTELQHLIKDKATVFCYHNVENIAELMLESDLFIGSAGIATWERCCLGLPSMVMTVTENQARIIEYLARNEILDYLGDAQDVTATDIRDRIDYFLSNSEILKRYSEASFKLVDGLGVQRCANAMFS